jgi:hypothetical protein
MATSVWFSKTTADLVEEELPGEPVAKSFGTSLWEDAWKTTSEKQARSIRNDRSRVDDHSVSLGLVLMEHGTGITADIHAGRKSDQIVPALVGSMRWGTDEQGRDILHVFYREDEYRSAVGLISTIVSLAVGVSYGAVAGYLGGKIDNVMMRYGRHHLRDPVHSHRHRFAFGFWRTEHAGFDRSSARDYSPADRRCRRNSRRRKYFSKDLWRE